VLRDVLVSDLRVVFCGTAAGSVSAKQRAYYAGPGNAEFSRDCNHWARKCWRSYLASRPASVRPTAAGTARAGRLRVRRPL